MRSKLGRCAASRAGRRWDRWLRTRELTTVVARVVTSATATDRAAARVVREHATTDWSRDWSSLESDARLAARDSAARDARRDEFHGVRRCRSDDPTGARKLAETFRNAILDFDHHAALIPPSPGTDRTDRIAYQPQRLTEEGLIRTKFSKSFREVLTSQQRQTILSP